MIWYCKTDSIKIEYIEDTLESTPLYESHCHTQYEMMAVVKGDITVTMEGEPIHLGENQLIIIPPFFFHSVAANKLGSYFRITALFDIDFIPEVIREGLTKQARKTTAEAYTIKKIKEICQSDHQSFYTPLLHSLITEVLYDTVQSPPAHAEIKIDDFLQKTFEYVDEHLQEKITLDDLAKVTTRSKSSFCHLFKEKMNISPKQYILKKKIALASKLIYDGVPITKAAKQIGYENYSDFYRFYRKHFKLPLAKSTKKDIEDKKTTK